MNTLRFDTADTHCGPLVLVNAHHPLPEEAPAKETLVPLGEYAGSRVLLCRTAAGKMRHLLAAAGAGGHIRPVSGWRSRAQQRDIYQSTLAEKGAAFAQTYVALPGCSEHETGLALDLGDEADDDFITPAFPATGAFARTKCLAPLFGFVERYPKGKTGVTGIGYEPWHYRYVGRPHAAIMAKNAWTLEEYIAVLARHNSWENALVYRRRGYTVRVFTHHPGPGCPGARLPAGCLWQASGNNAGGMVVTTWQ